MPYNENDSLKFFLDTHIAKAVAVQLRARSIDVLRCEEVGLAEAKDFELLNYAIEHRRVMVSKDEDFRTLHWEYLAQGKNHFGIFYFHKTRDAAIGQIVNYCSEYSNLVAQGAGASSDLVNEFHEES